jgi:hypothetical protein
VRLDSVDSMDAVSSEGDAGGVSGAEWMEAGVVGRGAAVMTGANLKMGEVDEGGVGGSSGCSGRGDDGGRGAKESTVAIVRDGMRGGMMDTEDGALLRAQGRAGDRDRRSTCCAGTGVVFVSVRPTAAAWRHLKAVLLRSSSVAALLAAESAAGAAVRGDIGIVVASCQFRRGGD